MRQKVTVVGAGNVGATVAQRIVEKEIADVVLVDIIPGVPQGKSLDILESAPVEGFDARMIGSNSYDESARSDVIVITAGVPRKPGMSRDDLVATNEGIVSDVVRKVLPGSPDAVLIVDSVFAFRPEYNEFWEYRIWLEVDAGLALQRGIARDAAREGTEDARRVHRDRYGAAEAIYLAEVDPLRLADLVIDNRDFARPRIIGGQAA